MDTSSTGEMSSNIGLHTFVNVSILIQSNLLQDIEYTVVIDDDAGSTVRETAVNCDFNQCNYTYYPAVGSRAVFGVSVEVAGCVTIRTVCLEKPVCELNEVKSIHVVTE